ncbi:MAG: hypothetical protein LBT74_10240 [Acidobacteriota bacterium]|jgi:hypothetical protein|nr:hypothetical protein [Acidobacteriota bacterium]
MTQVQSSLIRRAFERLHLRFPTLVAILGALTLIDLFVPDFIPLIDEIVLALLTLLFGMWKDRNAAPQGDSGREGRCGD